MDLMFRYASTAGTRYARSEPVSKLEPVRDPDGFPQRPGALDALLGRGNSDVIQHEDAFTVRVQGPDEAHQLPVLVFVPGGGFLSGTGMNRWFDQSDGEPRDHILVTVNYRLGILGHLGPEASPEASQRPLEDLLLALQWVQRFIEDFGGDPQNVTLAGDSAGAWYSYALASLPEAQGLFHRLALISLPRQAPQSDEEYQSRWEFAHQRLGDVGGFEDADIEQLLDVQQRMSQEFAGQGMALMPAAGGRLPADLHDYAANASRLHIDDILLLTCEDEAQAFLLPAPEQAFQDAGVEGFVAAHFAGPEHVNQWLHQQWPESAKAKMAAALTLYQFTTASYELAVACNAVGKRVYLGGFGVTSPLTQGSPHCLVLPFLFGGLERWYDAPMLDGIAPTIFEETATQLQEWFYSFVISSEPSVGTVAISQKPFDRATPQRLEFTDNSDRLSVNLAQPVEWQFYTRASASTDR